MSQVLINIDVPDIDKAITFYTQGLSLKVGRRFDTEFVELLGLTSPIYLLKKDAGSFPFPGAEVARSYKPHWCPVHMDIIVENIEETRDRIMKLGATEESTIRQAKYGKISMYRDPFGHGLCLIQFTGKGYDELLT